MGIALVPHLLIGLGGQGIIILDKIKSIAQRDYVDPRKHNGVPFPLVEYLGIDTTLQDVSHNNQKGEVALDKQGEIISLDISKAKAVFKNPGGYDPNIIDSIGDTDFLKSACQKFQEITEGCGGYPSLCRLASLLELEGIKNVIYGKLSRLTSQEDTENQLAKGNYLGKYSLDKGGTINVYIINSLSGGTGRGLYEIVAFLVKSLGAQLLGNEDKVKVRLFIVMPSIFHSKDISYAQINTYAGIKEIDHFLGGHYNAEKYLKDQINSHFVEKINMPIDFVYIIGNVHSTIRGEKAGPAFSNLREARDRIARFLADSIFTGVSSWALARESNLSNILSKEVIESSTNLPRNRRYMRVLFSFLFLPVDDIFEYVKLELKWILVQDLLDGFLPAPENIQLRKEKDIVEDLLQNDFTPGSYFSDLNGLDENIFGYVDREKIESEFQEFRDNLKDKVSKYESSLNSEIEQLLSMNEELRQKFLETVGIYGLDGLKRVIESVKEKLRREIAKSLGKSPEVLNLEKVEEDIKSKIAGREREIEKKLMDIKQYVLDRLSKYDNVWWNLKRIFMLSGGRLPAKEESNISSKILEFNNFLSVRLNQMDLDHKNFYKIQIIKKLGEYISCISEEIKIAEKEVELIEQKIKDIIDKTYKGGTVKMLLKNRKEGKLIFDAILNYLKETDRNKTDYIKEFDKDFMETDFYKYHVAQFKKEEGFEYDVRLKKVLDKLSKKFEEILNQRLDRSLKVLYVILKYLEKEKREFNYLRELLEEPITKLYFWSGITTSKEKGAGRAFSQKDTIFVKLLFPKNFSPEAEDEKVGEMARELQKRIENIMQKDFSPDFGVLDEAFLENQILVIGYHSGLSAFIFDELEECRRQYQNRDIEDRKFRHIKPEYVFLPEPIDISENIEDFFYLLNLAYQLKAIRGDLYSPRDEDKVARLRGKRIKYEPLIVRTKSGKEIPLRQITQEIFFAELVEKITQAVVEKFIYFLITCERKDPKFKKLRDFLVPTVSFANQKEKVIPFPIRVVRRLKEALNEYAIPDDRKGFLTEWLNKYNYNLAEEVKRDKTFKLCNEVYTSSKQKKMGLYVF